MKDPVRDRPYIPDYGINETEQGLLTWDWVNERTEKSKQYWISSTRANGRPHVTPVWGVWYKRCLYFGGGPDTMRSKNIAKNKYVTFNLESGVEAVIFDGVVEIEEDKQIENEVIKIYFDKYDLDHPPPFWKIIPYRCLTWDSSDYANTPTRFKM